MGSPSWKTPSIDEEIEIISGSEWVDKHEDEITRNSKPENRSHTQLEKRLSSLKRESSRGVDSSNKCNVDKGFELRKIPYEEESDETATSDCSETNLMWQLNVQVNMPRAAAAAASNGSLVSSTKQKKNQTKTSRVAETK